MTFPKKGTRKIEVDGQLYFYRLKHYDRHGDPCRDGDGVPEQTVMLFESEAGGPTYHWDFTVAVTPGMVAKAIRKSIS